MSLRYIWSRTELEAALAPAIAEGEHLITFRNITEATRFRMACYALRRRTRKNGLDGVGDGFSFILDPEALAILIKKTPKVKLQ